MGKVIDLLLKWTISFMYWNVNTYKFYQYNYNNKNNYNNLFVKFLKSVSGFWSQDTVFKYLKEKNIVKNIALFSIAPILNLCGLF